jgi:hypothetical protein
VTQRPASHRSSRRRPGLLLLIGLLTLVAVACGKKAAPLADPAATQLPAPTQSPSTQTASAPLDNTDKAPRAADLAGPSTILDAASLATAVTQGTLNEVRARIDLLTADADKMVALIEREPPTQTTLIQLNAVFSDTKRTLMTDTTLAALGLGLDAAARTAVAEYTRRSHEKLLDRLRTAGRNRRR